MKKKHEIWTALLLLGLAVIISGCQKKIEKYTGSKVKVSDVQKRIANYDEKKFQVEEIAVANLFDYMGLQMFQVTRQEEEGDVTELYLLNQKNEVRLIDIGSYRLTFKEKDIFVCEDIDHDGEYELAYATRGRTSGVSSVEVFMYHVKDGKPTLEHAEGFGPDGYGDPYLIYRNDKLAVKYEIEKGNDLKEGDAQETSIEYYPIEITEDGWKVTKEDGTAPWNNSGDGTEQYLQEEDPDNPYYRSDFKR